MPIEMDLLNEKKKLEHILKTSKNRLSKLTAGKLRVFTKYGGQYYLYNSVSNKWDYVSKKNLDLVKPIAQFEYETMVVKEVEEQIKLIDQFIAVYDQDIVGHIQSSMIPARLKLISPHILSVEEYTAQWLSTPYASNPYPIENGFLTIKGDFVRSKSESIIADRLYSLNIPYKYECPCHLSDGTIYPDFTILNVNTRTEILLEHFGRMDDPEYVNRSFMPKLTRYIKNGYELGKNLLFSFETLNHSLNIGQLQRLITHCLDENTL